MGRKKVESAGKIGYVGVCLEAYSVTYEDLLVVELKECSAAVEAFWTWWLAWENCGQREEAGDRVAAGGFVVCALSSFDVV